MKRLYLNNTGVLGLVVATTAAAGGGNGTDPTLYNQRMMQRYQAPPQQCWPHYERIVLSGTPLFMVIYFVDGTCKKTEVRSYPLLQ